MKLSKTQYGILKKLKDEDTEISHTRAFGMGAFINFSRVRLATLRFFQKNELVYISHRQPPFNTDYKISEKGIKELAKHHE